MLNYNIVGTHLFVQTTTGLSGSHGGDTGTGKWYRKDRVAT